METKYTNEQIRSAILRAADRIERDPNCYEFFSQEVPACGTPGCMWGLVGAELGIDVGTLNMHVAIACGFEATSELYSVAMTLRPGHPSQPAFAVRVLREFCRQHFPSPSLDSAFVRFRERFVAEQEAV